MVKLNYAIARHACRAFGLMILTLGVPRLVRADESISAAHELVIAGHPVSTETGLKVLHDGGNAADAFLAVSLSLGITEPGNSGLGGKMVLLYYDAKTKTVSSVIAMAAGPMAATRVQLKALAVKDTEKGWKSVCTPGMAAGLGEVYKRWGTKPWAELCQPAIDQAEHGITIIPTAAAMFKDFTPGVDAEATRIYAPGGSTPTVGTVFKNPDLAHTLKLISEKGAQAFYESEIADKFVAASKTSGGYLSAEDFTSYHARSLEPLKGSFEKYTVYSSPPPLDGGATVLIALKCAEKMDWTGAAPRNPKYIDTFSRVMQQVYPEVYRSAADVPDSLDRVASIMNDHAIDAAVTRAKQADPHLPYGQKQKTARANYIGDLSQVADAKLAEMLGDDSDRASTTHLVIVDKAGNIVCCTQSLGLHFGSDVVAAGTGVLLNADISNFSVSSDKSVNAFAPGKWPRSTMSPTIFMLDGSPKLVIGSPAGARIPSVVLQVSLDVLKFGVPLKQAVEAPRFHIISGSAVADGANHVDLELTCPTGLEASLTALGWQPRRRPTLDFYFGSVNAAMIDGSHVTGVADQRRTADAGGD